MQEDMGSGSPESGLWCGEDLKGPYALCCPASGADILAGGEMVEAGGLSNMSVRFLN